MIALILAVMLGGNTCEPLPEGQSVLEVCYDHVQNVDQCQRLDGANLDAGLAWCEGRELSAQISCCEPEAHAYFECMAMLSCGELFDPPQCVSERMSYAACLVGAP